MRSPKLVGLSACLSLLCALPLQAQLPQIGIQFLGRDQFPPNDAAGNKPPVPGLLQNDVAGVLPQANWYTIDNQYAFNAANVGVTGTLWDSNLAPLSVTLSFVGNDSWDDDVDPSKLTTPNARLMVGTIKSNGGDGKTESFEFDSVPEGQYDLIVYLTMNGDGVWADVADNDNLTTYYVKEWHQFYDTNTFVQATNTDPNGVRDTGNYVRLTNLGTYGRGSIGGYVTRRGTAGDGTGVPALQLVPRGPALANTTPLSFLVQPISRRGGNGFSNVTFTTTIRGPAFYLQWRKNGVAVPGETNVTFTPAPIDSTYQNAQISVTASNNLNSITSSNAILTVGTMLGTNNTSPMDGGILSITLQPTNVTLVAGEGGSATFYAGGVALGYIGDASTNNSLLFQLPPVTFQWQSAPKGSTAFTAIAGATGGTYVTPIPVLTDDGTQFRAIVTAGGTSSNTTTVTMNVLPDTIPPVLHSATALQGSTQVGLSFSEALDPASAVTLANYTVNGAPVVAAYLRTNVANELTREQNLVSLIAAAPVTGSLTVTVTGLKDVAGIPMTLTNVIGKVLGMTSTDIGSSASDPGGPDPKVVTVVTNWGDGNFDVLCGGNDYYNNADGINFVWEPKTNSFDVKVRVVSVENIDNWSAGAIMVREGPVTTNGGGWELARHYFCKVDYGGPTVTIDASGSGANSYEYNCRLATGDPSLRETSNNGQGGSRGWGGSGVGNPAPVPYPNAWIRIARVKSISNNVTNDHMMGYSSSDGANWNLIQDVDLMDATHAGFATISNGPPAGPLPDVLYVGLASTAHNNGTNAITSEPYQCWVVYRNWGDTAGQAVGGSPTVSVAHNADGTITLTYTGNLYSSAAVNGTYTKVSAATSPFNVNPKASGAATSTFYRAGP